MQRDTSSRFIQISDKALEALSDLIGQAIGTSVRVSVRPISAGSNASCAQHGHHVVFTTKGWLVEISLEPGDGPRTQNADTRQFAAVCELARPILEGLFARQDAELAAAKLYRECAELRYKTRYDQMTGLLSRDAFEHEVRLYLSKPELSGTLVYMDLDGLKLVNDMQGHAAGDRLLAAFGRQVKQHLRQSDLAGRLGGDEFSVFLAGMQEYSTVKSVVERLAPPNFSWGMAPASDPNGFADALAQADMAMLSQKLDRRGRAVRALA